MTSTPRAPIVQRFLVPLMLTVCAWAWSRAGEPRGIRSEKKPSDAGLYPAALAVDPSDNRLFIACSADRSLLVFDRSKNAVSGRITLPGSPSGIVSNRDGSRLYVTCSAARSLVCEIDMARSVISRTDEAGYDARSPVLAPDGGRLFFCNRFDDSVTIHDLSRQAPPVTIAVPRQPIALAVTPDGKTLLVAHHLPDGRADLGTVAAGVSVIDVAGRCVKTHLALPSGSSLLRDIKVSPDGKIAAVSHNLARFQMPTTQVDRGWMNTGALTLIDVPALSVLNTVLLDNVDRGAANPWAVGWSADGKTLVATHAGTHDLSIIDAAALLQKLRALPVRTDSAHPVDPSFTSRVAADVRTDLAFLVALRTRLKLEGNGPRSLAFWGSRLCIANYFSDTLESIDLGSQRMKVQAVALGPVPQPSAIRRGERLFNDATLAFQGWQSCASCHSDDGRLDGLNWDLLNDGLGNPKNTRSLLWAHRTAPVMSLGVRESAEFAVRSGMRHILFAHPDELAAADLDCYLRSLEPLPSPALERGQLSAAAVRGAALFRSEETGCANCHAGSLRTDRKSHDVGTCGPFDQGEGHFDTPALVELWRTAPYLHDGSCANLRELLSTRNKDGRHGQTSQLSHSQIDDLITYLMSL